MTALRQAMCVLTVLMLLMVAFIGWNIAENQTFEETFYTLSSTKLSTPLRLVLLTDLHQLNFGPDNQILLDRIAALAPDMIVLGGDIINSEGTDPDYALRLCRRLTSVAPVYYGPGNHENRYVYGRDLGKSLPLPQDGHADFSVLEINGYFSELENAGVHVMQNRILTADIGGQCIEIGGVSTDEGGYWLYSGDLVYQWTHSDSSAFRLLICHRPHVVMRFIPDAALDLAVSGHLHGGGMRLPGLGGVYGADHGFFPGYDGGLYRSGDMTLIVSRGFAGMDWIPRILNKPELVVIDLQPEP